jgi:hypothetical protein
VLALELVSPTHGASRSCAASMAQAFRDLVTKNEQKKRRGLGSCSMWRVHAITLIDENTAVAGFSIRAASPDVAHPGGGRAGETQTAPPRDPH